MSRDTEYEAALSKNLILITRNKDLEEQLATKSRQWQQVEEEYKKVEALARKLCEDILAKDRTQMVLGKNRSWSDTPTDQLLLVTRKSYREYNIETTRILNSIQQTSEERRAENESLRDQIQQMLSSGQVLDYITEEPQPEDKPATQPPALPPKLQDIASSGTVEVIIEEDGDVEIDGEMMPINELLEISEQTKVVSNAIPIKDSAQKARRMEKERDEKMAAHLVDLAELEKRVNDSMWLVLEVIGSTGVAKYPDIESSSCERDGVIAKSRVRMSTQMLYKMKALEQQSVSLPLSPRVYVYTLSDIGRRLYKKRTGENPVQSEVDALRKEHDNIEHGYGILDVEKMLKESGQYKEIHVYNRQRAIKVSDGLSYVPDIVAIPKQGKYTEYIEYERGRQNQRDFSAKCNKMTKVTRFLNFVAPSRNVIETKLMQQVAAWIESRGSASLKNIKVRLTTPQELRNPGRSAWLVEYDLSKGSAPVKGLPDASKNKLS